MVNDPVLDPPTETAFLRDEVSGEVWTAAPTAGITEAPYKITHGRGYSRFDHERNGITHEMIVYVPLEDPVKIMKVKLKNNSAIQREISITYYAEWVLGVERQSNSPHIVTEWHESAKVLTARNTYQETFREATAFLGMYQQLPADSSTFCRKRTYPGPVIGVNLSAEMVPWNTPLPLSASLYPEAPVPFMNRVVPFRRKSCFYLRGTNSLYSPRL